MTSFRYVMNYLHLRGTASSQMHHLQSVHFHKDDILLVWKSRHEFIVCNYAMSVHCCDVSGSTVYFFSCFPVVMMDLHQPIHRFGHIPQCSTLFSCP